MRVLAIGLFAVGVASCETSDPTIPMRPPAEVGIQGTYMPARCYIGSGSGAPPCTTYSSPSGQARLDSARAVFLRDGSVTWQAAFWTRSCIFPNGTCEETITRRSENAAGTYVIGVDGLTLSLSEAGRNWTMRFNASIPAAVGSSWAGPDTLLISTSSQAQFGVGFAKPRVP